MRVHSAFILPALPRHPLLRAALAVAGTLLLACLLVLGAAAGAALLVAAAAAMLWRRWTRRPTAGRGAGPDTIEGEFTVIDRRRSRWLPGARNG
jgi:membrane protein implicated in regulation of membrane protease activity